MLQDDQSSEHSFQIEEEPKPCISTSKLLDDIYDIHLAELPQDLYEAMQLADKVRSDLLLTLY
jgi:hypothetical protein